MFEKEAEEYLKKLLKRLKIKVEDLAENQPKYLSWEKMNFISLNVSNVSEAFQKGAEFGYNKAKEELEEKYKETLCNSELNLASVTQQLEELEKANEWHYVKDCLPPKKKLNVGAKSETVYVATRGYGIYIGYYNFSRKVWYLADNDYQEISEVYAWCELPIPPKESE